MAACMRSFLFGKSSKIRHLSTSAVRIANAVAVQDAEPIYPPVKPRYPPGRYGSLTEATAWGVDTWRNELLAVPRVKARLEKIAGETSRLMWIMEALDRRPRNIDFRQRLLKTHVVKDLPGMFAVDETVASVYERIRPVLMDHVGHDWQHQHQKAGPDAASNTELQQSLHHLVGGIVRSMMVQVAASNEHILRSQLDEDVRVETFWYVGGFTGEGNKCDGQWPDMKLKHDEDAGILMFQYRHKANWQIRTELPLPDFVDMNDLICKDGAVPRPDFSPKAIAMKNEDTRPITMSGHWVGDPCEFTSLSLHVLPLTEYKELQEVGMKYAEESQLSFGMTAGFGSCAAQAYNQGFSYLHDLTYPFTTQCVVTDGQMFRFFAYQLNTLRLWVDDGSEPSNNPLRNVVWASEPMPLYNPETQTINDDVLKLLLRCILLRPAVRHGVEMRPYLPDEEAPVQQSVFLNRKGEEYLPYVKIGQFQYPRNAVYF